MNCPYCGTNRGGSRVFKSWRAVNIHANNCNKSTHEYYIHIEYGPIHYTNILEYRGIFRLTRVLSYFRKHKLVVPKLN